MGLLSLLNNKMYVSIDEVLNAIKLHINDSNFYSEHKILLEILQQSEIEVFEKNSGLWGALSFDINGVIELYIDDETKFFFSDPKFLVADIINDMAKGSFFNSMADYKENFGFKKTEIENIIKQFDDSFSFTQPNNELPKIDHDQEGLQDDLNQLTTELQQAHGEIDRLKAELEQAQTLLAEKPKIEYVEVKDNRLETLLDEHGEHYAPDLAHAVNLWLSLYGNGKTKDDSHTNLSQVWIKNNTGYHEQQNGFSQVEKRIREITTPFKEWATARNKNHKK